MFDGVEEPIIEAAKILWWIVKHGFKVGNYIHHRQQHENAKQQLFSQTSSPYGIATHTPFHTQQIQAIRIKKPMDGNEFWFVKILWKFFGGLPLGWAVFVSSLLLIFCINFVVTFVFGFIAGIMRASNSYGYTDYSGQYSLIFWVMTGLWIWSLFYLYKKFKPYSSEASLITPTHKTQIHSDSTIQTIPIDEEAGTLKLGKHTTVSQNLRQFHTYVVGKTGSGKSRALQYWLQQDIEAGRGCAFIDAHGDVVEGYLRTLAQQLILKGVPLEDVAKNETVEDLVIIDPTDTDYAIGINPIKPFAGYTPQQMGYLFSSAIKDLYFFEKQEGSNMEEVLANTAHVLSENNLTLLEANELLKEYKKGELAEGQKSFRVLKAEHIENKIVQDYWIDDFETMLQNHPEYVQPAKRKIRKFIADDNISMIIGQNEKVLDFRKLIDGEQIVLCKIPTGGGEVGNFFGALIISLFEHAALSRDPLKQNPHFYLYVDEFGEFTSGAFPHVLSQARKFGLAFILSHQYKNQVSEPIQDAIMKNAHTMVAFDVDSQDAELLAKEFFTITGRRIKHLRESVRMIHNGLYSQPEFELVPTFFSVQEEILLNAQEFTKLHGRQFIVTREGLDKPEGDITEDMPVVENTPQIQAYVNVIKRASFVKWGKKRSEVVEEIQKRWHDQGIKDEDELPTQ